MTMPQSVSNGSGRPRRALALLGRAAFVCAVIFGYALACKVVSMSCRTSPSSYEKFSIRVSYEMGPESKASRCAGDCSQPGDIYTAVIAHSGPPENTTSIYMFDESRFLALCWDCTMLSYTVQHIGKLHVIGSSVSRQCKVDRSSMDNLAASLQKCGTIEYSSFDIR